MSAINVSSKIHMDSKPLAQPNKPAVDDDDEPEYENYQPRSKDGTAGRSPPAQSPVVRTQKKKPQPVPKPQSLVKAKVAEIDAKAQQQPRSSPPPKLAATPQSPVIPAASPTAGQLLYTYARPANRVTRGASLSAAGKNKADDLAAVPIYEEAVPVIQKPKPVNGNSHMDDDDDTAIYEEALPRRMPNVPSKPDNDTAFYDLYEDAALVREDLLPASERSTPAEPLYAEAVQVVKERLPPGEKPRFVAPPPPPIPHPRRSVNLSPGLHIANDGGEGLYEEAAVVCKQAAARDCVGESSDAPDGDSGEDIYEEAATVCKKAVVRDCGKDEITATARR